MSALLDESVKQLVKQRFDNMKAPVTIKVFSSKNHCLFCNEMEQLVGAVAEISKKIKVEHCDCGENDPMAKKYGIVRHPALAIEGDQDYGIRFFGVPAGKEFTTLIESIMLVSGRDPLLNPKTLELVNKIKKPVNLKVFVTLECPYCPAMVLRAQKIALANPNVTAEMIEASQFGQLASDFDIFGVPNTIINDGLGNVEGLVPEDVLVNKILELIK